MKAARRALGKARVHLAARQSRRAIAQAHLACRLASAELHRRSKIHAAGGAPATRGSLAAFYRRLDALQHRLEAGSIRQLHLEEAEALVRQAGWFVSQLEDMIRRAPA